MTHPATYRAAINRAIKHLRLTVRACVRDGGYSYFVDSDTGDQVGESVMVYRQHFLSLDQWVSEATSARATRPL
jgi:hypothetical protein